MAEWYVTLAGLVICLGIFGGVFVYFLIASVDTEDSTRIDPIPKEKDINLLFQKAKVADNK